MKDRNPPYRIPTAEELARATSASLQKVQHLDEIGALFRQRFERTCPLTFFSIMPQRDVKFRAYVFLETNSDIVECKATGILQEMREFVYESLVRYGRGKRDEVTLAFEIDSFENVKRNFEGNIYLRLRSGEVQEPGAWPTGE